jgi:hypothetical protein
VDEFSSSDSEEGLDQRLSTPVRIDVFDVLGRRVIRLYSARVIGSAVTVAWDGTNSAGRSLPSGVYFVRASVGDIREVRKVLLVR